MYKKDRGPGRGRGFFNKPPVNTGDEIEVEIEGVGSKGDGIARKEGFVLFVPDTKKGDKVKVKVTRVLRSVGFAEKVNGETEEKKESIDEVEQTEPIEDTEDF